MFCEKDRHTGVSKVSSPRYAIQHDATSFSLTRTRVIHPTVA
jgi:hypothetical protein